LFAKTTAALLDRAATPLTLDAAARQNLLQWPNMAATYTISYGLPRNREQLGRCTVYRESGNGPQVICPTMAVLARSDNAIAKAAGNPRRDPLKRNGDFPLGEYEAVIVSPSADTHKFGPYRRLLFIPKGGDALKARDAGRGQLMAHSGDLNPTYTWWQGLRPTLGCVRHFDEDMNEMMQVFAAEPGCRIYSVATELVLPLTS
jgi:hypothetical protein